MSQLYLLSDKEEQLPAEIPFEFNGEKYTIKTAQERVKVTFTDVEEETNDIYYLNDIFSSIKISPLQTYSKSYFMIEKRRLFNTLSFFITIKSLFTYNSIL